MVVVFDLDGTLVDSRGALLAAHDVAWASVGRARPPTDEILSLIGLPLTDTMLRLAPDLDPSPLVEAYSVAYVKAAATHEQLFDGVRELLARPFRAAVATGKGQGGADRVVRDHGLTGRFEVVLGGNAVRRPKPYPDLLHEIAEHTGSRDLLMVGDTTFDLEMAQNAKART